MAIFLLNIFMTGKKKSHIPSQTNFDLAGAMAHFTALSEDVTVNWEETGRMFGIAKANAGQVLKETLKKNGINVESFHNSKKRRQNLKYKRRMRRKLKGTKTSMPKHLSKNAVKKNMQEKVEAGVYHIHTNNKPATSLKMVQLIMCKQQLMGMQFLCTN